MENIKLYTVSDKYIDYLSIYAPHLFHNKKPNQIKMVPIRRTTT